MAKKRAKVEIDYDKDLFSRTEAGRRPEERHPRSPSKHRLEGRATWDIGYELKEAIRQHSVALGVPASQFARYLLLYGLDDFVNGRIPPPTLLPSDSPAYMHNIDFEE